MRSATAAVSRSSQINCVYHLTMVDICGIKDDMTTTQSQTVRTIFASERITPPSFTRVTIDGVTVDIQERYMEELVNRFLRERNLYLVDERGEPTQLRGMHA